MSKEGTEGCETCREPGLLLWLGAGTLEENERTRVEKSVDGCPVCRVRVAENEALALAVRAARLGSVVTPSSPEALIRAAEAPAEEREKLVAVLSPDDRAMVEVLRAVDAELEARDRRPRWLGWLHGLLAAVAPAPGAGLGGWLRSPAIAYLAVLALAYPAYLGSVAGTPGGELAPAVLSSPHGIDASSPNRGAETASITVGGGAGPSVITVFVPIDERYRYRLEILDADERSRFRDDDAKSFDGYGTFAVMLPEDFLTAGEYELRVDELAKDGQSIEVFRFPFEVQR